VFRLVRKTVWELAHKEFLLRIETMSVSDKQSKGFLWFLSKINATVLFID